MKLEQLLAELRPSELAICGKTPSVGMDLVRIYSEDWSDHIDTVDLNDDCRDPARCGGCGYCILAQALHAGCRVAPEYDVVMSPELLAERKRTWKCEGEFYAFVDWSQP